MDIKDICYEYSSAKARLKQAKADVTEAEGLLFTAERNLREAVQKHGALRDGNEVYYLDCKGVLQMMECKSTYDV